MNKNLFLKVLLFSIALFCIVILYLTFISFRYQAIMLSDLKSKELSISFEEASNIPPIPNVSITTLPIKALLAPYIINDNPNKAYELLTEASDQNPYIYYSEYLLAVYFLQSKNYDSALKYSKKAFYNWPKNLEHYKLLNKVLEAEKDTVEILKAYSYINKRFFSKEKYYLSFVDSYSNAKLRYLIFDYPDKTSVSKSILIGEWQQMYEFEGGKINYLDKKMSFSKNVFSNNGNKYLYDLKNDTLRIKFFDSNQIISQIPIFYSDSLQTLIFKDIPTEANVDIPKLQDQFFKKINK